MPGQKLHILQITNRLPWPLNDGGNLAAWNVGNGLVKIGHDVTLASLNTKKHFVKDSEVPGYTKIHSVFLNTDPSNLQALLHLFSSIPYNISRFQSAAFGRMLEKTVTENQFNIIQLEGIYLGIYLPVIRKFFKGKVILRAHNVEHRIWKRMAAAEKNIVKKWYFNHLAKGIERFEKNILNDFDALVPISTDDAAWFSENGFSGKMQPIPGGAEILPEVKPGAHKKKNAICFIGSLEWLPNVEGVDWFLANIWPKILEQVPDCEFHLAGKNPPEKYSQMQIPGFHFWGEVADAGKFMDPFSVMVIPLLSGSGMRMKAVEAMGRGLAVVGTPVGLEGIPGTSGLHFLSENTEKGIARHIIEVLKNPHLLENISREGHTFARENYSWEKLVKRFEELYFALK